MNELFMVFDVESIGLHGEGFAVGFVVVNKQGAVLDEQCISCHPVVAQGNANSYEWVAANVPALPYSHDTTAGVRHAFWNCWLTWKAKGAVLVADCCWPVEARFLNACVDDEPIAREWEGPYPLHDLASILLAHGRDPLAITERLPSELPAHHPLNDARQSARQLIELLRNLQ